jgi:hypothetical protein
MQHAIPITPVFAGQREKPLAQPRMPVWHSSVAVA